MTGIRDTLHIQLKRAVNRRIFSTSRSQLAESSIVRNDPSPEFEALLKAFEIKDFVKVKELLTSSIAVNYKEPVRKNKTPLIYATKYNYFEAVKELLEKGADPKLADDSGITPLHTAANYGCLVPLKILLDSECDVNARDKNGKTPLHYATRALGEDDDNAFNIVKALLKAGATLSAKDDENRTALHEAAFAGNKDVLSLLLMERGASLLSERDKNGRTPLHQAVLGARSIAAVNLLLQHYPPVDAKDNDGCAPLHYVAARPINYIDKEFDGYCLELLLHYGASVQNKDNKGFNALSLALQRTMWWSRQSPRDAILHSVQLLVAKGSEIVDGFDMWRIVETFPSMVMVALNQSIRTNTSAKDSPYLKLILNFSPLTVSTRLLAERKRQTLTPVAPSDEMPFPEPLLNDTEISMLHYIFWAGNKNLLRHPLCSAFLHLKWLKVRKYFVINVIIYFLFVLFFTNFILSSMNNDDKMKMRENANNNSELVSNNISTNDTTYNFFTTFDSDVKSFVWFILLFFSITFLTKEILQIVHSPSIYIRHHENYMDIIILVSVLILLFRNENELYSTYRNISTIAIIACWSRFMLFLGQFPSCGVYIVMFSTVCKTVFQFLAMYIPLLIAFALGFQILLNGQSSFDGIITSMVTTLIMMTGEIDYDSKFLQTNNMESRLIPFLVLTVFLLLIYIILSNLLVALAVNDLNSIQQRSEILRLSRQVELMVTVEKFLKSPFVPKAVRQFFQKQFSIFDGHSETTVVILPNKKPGYVERLFVKLIFIFRCRRILTKIFEYFVVNFIPPDLEPSLPKRLVEEAIQLALTELEIEKRDKLLFSKSHQIGSMRQRALNKKQKQNQKNSVFPHFPKRDSLQENSRNCFNTGDDCDTDPHIMGFRHHVGVIQPTPSIKASLWRASIRKEAFKNIQSNIVNNDRQTLTDEIEQLHKNIATLQRSIDVLTDSISPVKPSEELKRNSYPFAMPKIPVALRDHSFHPPAESIAEQNPRQSDASRLDLDGEGASSIEV